MQINDMNLTEVEARLAEIESEIEQRSGADLEVLKQEVIQLQERKAELETIEQRAQIAQQLNSGKAIPDQVIEKSRKGDKTMTLAEIRSSADYGRAFLKAIKTGDDSEARALLTEHIEGGQIPVPTFLENEIKTAWESYQLVALVKHSYFKGIVKVGFELSATGANVHVEGSEAPTEEVVTIGTVEIKPESIKKWITVSDEALEGTTVDTMGYLYKEIAQKIVEKAEEIIIAKILACPTTSSATAVAVPVHAQNPAAETIVTAISLLSAQARNLYIAMNRQTYPTFVALALKAGYAIDVFDGLKDKIVFTDKLPAFSAASVGNTYMVIGDFGYGFQTNFPNGNELTIKVDDLSLAEKDLVKLVGRQYVGFGVVAPKAFVKVNKVAGV